MITEEIRGNAEPVSVALELHHHRLDDMLDRIEIDVEAGNWSEGRRGFSLFRRELEEHMRLEEEVLLPAVGVRWQINYGPPALLRADHARIRERLDVVEVGLENEYPIEEATDVLEAMLADHNAREEHLLYPMFERLATPEAYAAATFELRPLIKGRGSRVRDEAPAGPVPLNSLLHIRRPAMQSPVP
jgi:hemerythrin HHE cation binding domain-containing protein